MLAATLIEKEKTDYVLDSVVTWGNLYIVGTDESALSEEGMFAAFGEAAVPQKVLMSSMDMDTIKGEIKYFGSANEVSGLFLRKRQMQVYLQNLQLQLQLQRQNSRG